MNRKINVLHLINELEPGGAEVLLVDLAKERDRDRFSYAVAYLYGQGTLRGAIENHAVKVYDLSLSGKKNPLMLFSIVSLLKKLRIDVLNCHLVLSSVVGPVAARIAGTGVVVTTRHYDYHEDIKSIRFKIDRFMSRYCDCMIAVSAETMRIVREEKLKLKDIRVIHNAVDTDFFQPHHGISGNVEGGIVIGTIGRLTPQKGYKTFLRVIASLRDQYPMLRADIVGVGPQESELREFARTLGLSDCVRFLGRVDRNEIKRLLSEWRAFVLTSDWEAFGIVVIEAMSMRLPVVVSRVGGLPEIVRDGIDGFLVEPGDVDGFVDKVSYLLEHPSEAAQMGKNGRQRVIENFSIRKIVREYEELYLNLMESKSPAVT